MPELIPPHKPSRSYGYLSIAVLAVAAVVALAAAWGALVAIEHSSRTAVVHELYLAGEEWAEVETDGLQVILSGNAPSEVARFAALSAAGREVDGARVIDQMVLPDAVAIVPPRFSIEMLRNQAGISLIGLIPEATDRDALVERMRAIDPIQPVADFLETAAYPTPEGWEAAVDFLLYVAAMMPQSKVSMDADRVTVEAIAGSPTEKADWEQAIRRERPAGQRLALDIRSPHEVVSPFIMRFLSDDQGVRFDACTAHNAIGRNTIVSAGIAAGVKGRVDCKIGLGVPSPDWAEAVARGIRAVSDLGGGTLTYSDADVTLVAPEDTPQDAFDQVVGELEADLPEVYSLHGVRPVSETGPISPAGPPEFIATLSDSGSVQLRGRVASEQDRTVVESLARARFGTRKVYAPLRLDPALPANWAVRTLAGLEALDQLADGRVVVQPDVVTVTGTTGDRGASAEISRLLSEKLGEAEDFRVNVKYEEALDPIATMPTPQECAADVNAILAKSKIAFAPGSAEIERASLDTVDRVAEIVKSCPDVAMEIGGYTDSQGREEMNQALSQRRAEAVVSALLARRVLTTNLQAFGYGEEHPIADNETEEGREANRRIEFRLIGETRPHRDADPDDRDMPTIRPPARPEGLGESPDESADESEPPEGEAGPAPDPDEPVATVDGAEPETEAEAPGSAVEEVDGQDTAGEPAPDGVPAAPDADPGAQDMSTARSGDPAPDGAPTANAEADAGFAATPDTAAPATVDSSPAEPAPASEAPDTERAPALPEGTADADPANDPAPASATDTIAPDGVEPTDPVVGGDGDGAEGTGPLEADPATSPEAAPTTPAVDETGSVDPETPDPAPEGPATDTATDTPTDMATDTATDTTGLPAAALTEVVPEEAGAEDAMGAGEAGAETAAVDPSEEIAAVDASVDEAPTEADAPGASPAPEAEAQAQAEDEPTPASQDGDDPEAAPQTEEEPLPDLPPETGETPDPQSATETEAPLAATDMTNTRPRARPPLVVHPDLEGVRPRPRPVDIPDAPSTE